MTNSKAPWLTRGGAIALMAAAGIALAACSGGGGLNEDEAAGLQQELEDAKADAAAALADQQLEEAARIAAEAAQALAEAEKLKAETEKVAAETARDAAVALAEAAEKSAAAAAASAQDAAAALVEALAAQVEAEAKQAEAEAARDDAEAAADEADRLRLAAERAEADEAQRRRDAEAARDEAEQDTEDAEQAANAAEAAIVHIGLDTGLSDTMIAHTLSAMPQYRAAANLTTPDIEGTGAGSSGRWFRTSGSSQSMETTQHVLLYSDVEAPDSVPFKDSTYNMDDAVVDAEGMVLEAGYELTTGLRMDVASGSFDRTSSPAKSFDIRDRGFDDQADKDAEILSACPVVNEPCPARSIPVRNTDRHPHRYSAEAGGNLGGARGTFRCGSTDSTAATSCTVQNTGGGFVFRGPWFFVPSSGTVGVSVEDAQYMWFGWWSTETATTFTFDTNNGGTAELTALTGVTGTATYNGIAVGQYAISGTLVANQGHGEFTANARLTADFGEDTNTVIGSITNISGQPDWEISLTGGVISGAAVTGSSTSWTIGGDTQDLSTENPWEANFYSNLPVGDRAGVQPYGIAGTFEASHGSAARMAGAFGAHR